MQTAGETVVGYPFRIFDIGLPSWHCFDMLGVYYHQCKPIFQEIVDWFPVYSGAFHSHMGDFKTKKPVLKLQKVFGHRTKSTRLFPPRLDYTGHYTFFVDIQTTAPGVYYFHMILLNLSYWSVGDPAKQRHCYACSRLSEATIYGASGSPVQIALTGSWHQSLPNSFHWPAHKYFHTSWCSAQAGHGGLL